jgi:hypothetical protein
VLLIIGWFRDELGPKGIAVTVVLFFAGRLGIAYVPNGASLVQSWTAILDIALVLVVFKGDVRLA